MIRFLPIVVFFLVPSLVQAQETPVGTSSMDLAPETVAHVLQIVEGRVYVDGELLPDAVPEGLDLSGIQFQFAYGEGVTPVIEVDRVSYVLEDQKLVPLQESGRAGEPVFPVTEEAEGIVEQAAAPVSQDAYMEELSEEDRALYEKVRRERELEAQAHRVARQIRTMPPGESRDAAEGQLREIVTQAFDLKQEIDSEELVRARRQIEELHEILIRRTEERDAIIDARIEELVGGN